MPPYLFRRWLVVVFSAERPNNVGEPVFRKVEETFEVVLPDGGRVDGGFLEGRGRVCCHFYQAAPSLVAMARSVGGVDDVDDGDDDC